MSENAAYASVGGLGKQIEAIRDLLEIPLTRPELFRHFGTFPFLSPLSYLHRLFQNMVINVLYTQV